MNLRSIHFPAIAAKSLAGAMIALLSSCGDPEDQQSAERPRPVKVIEVHNGGVPKTVEFPGQIMAVQQTWKAFEVTGRITELPVKESDIVRKGDLLARLDPRDFRSARDSAKARHESAVAVEARLRPLFEKRAVSQQQLELAERDTRTAKANLERAQKALDDTELVADFDGTVAKIMVDDFANVAAKENVMLIQDTSSLEIIIHVPESILAIPIEGEGDAERVAKANPVVIPSTMPEQRFPAKYAEASDTADPVTRTYQVTLAFTPPPELQIHPGMTAKVQATIPANERSRSQGYPLPAASVFSDDQGRAHVWRVDPESLTIAPAMVEMGAVVGDSIVVTGEITDGDIIAASGVHQLRAGQKIRIWNQPPANGEPSRP